MSEDADKYDWRTDIDLEIPVEKVWGYQGSDRKTDEQSELTENNAVNSEENNE